MLILYHLLQAKYGQRKQGWRVDSERSNTGRASEPSADEENNNLSENQDDTHDEEVDTLACYIVQFLGIFHYCQLILLFVSFSGWGPFTQGEKWEER